MELSQQVIALPLIGNNKCDTHMATGKNKAKKGSKVTKGNDGREQKGVSRLPAACKAGGLALQFYQQGGKSLERIINPHMSSSRGTTRVMRAVHTGDMHQNQGYAKEERHQG